MYKRQKYDNGTIATHPSTRPEDFFITGHPTNFPDATANLTYYGEELTNIERVYLGSGTTEPAVSNTFVETEAAWNSYIDLHHGSDYQSKVGDNKPSANTFTRLAQPNHVSAGAASDSSATQGDLAYYKVSKYVGETNNSADYNSISASDQVFRFHLVYYSPNYKDIIFPENFPSLDNVGFTNAAASGSGANATYSEAASPPLWGEMPYLQVVSQATGNSKTEIIKVLEVNRGTNPAHIVCLRGQLNTTAQTWSVADEPALKPYSPSGTASEIVHKFVYSATNSLSASVTNPNPPITEAALCFMHKELSGSDWTNPNTADTTKTWTAFSRIKFTQPWTRTAEDDIEIYWTIRIS